MKNNSSVPNAPQVNDDSKIEGLSESTQPNNKKKIAVTVLVAAVILLGLASLLYYKNKNSPNIVFNVNGKNYSQTYIKSLAAYPTIVSRKPYSTAAKEIYGLLEYKSAAEAIGIKFTDSQLQQFRQERGSRVYKQSNYESYLDLVAFKVKTGQYLASAAVNNASGRYEGYSFVFHFDETLSYGSAYKSPYYGNQTMLASDKKYAQTQADYYHTQLAQHKITPDSALAKIVADPQLGYYYKPNNNYSAHFGTSLDSNWQREVFFPPITAFIKQQKKPGLSSIQTGKVSTVPDPTSDSQYADGYYYFVLLTQVQPPLKNPQQTLQQSLDTVSKHSRYYGGLHA